MDDDQEEEDVGESDPRMMILYSYLSKTMKFKVDKWQKMMSFEDHKALMLKFVMDPSMPKLVINMTSAGMLVPMTDFPTTGKFKSTYFLRLQDVVLTEQNMRQVLLIGDMSPRPVDEFQVFLEHVLVPLLQGVSSVDSWGKDTIDDVKRKALDMRDEVVRVRGLTQGLTYLPLPLGMEKAAEEEAKLLKNPDHRVDFTMKHNMEIALYSWGEQINKLLSENTKDLLEKEKDATPSLDLNFWSGRLKDFENIYSQLKNEKVRSMASILELTRSPFYDVFKNIFQNVVAALDEARSIDRYLFPLRKYLDAIDSTDLFEAQDLFVPLVYTICLIWINCPYFKQTDKIITLFKEICNLIIAQSEKCLDPPSIFAGEIEETLPKLRKVVENMKKFKEVFIQFQHELPEMFPDGELVYPWNFHHDTILKFPYEEYIYRLECIENIFVTCMDYMRLEKVETGGWSGAMLSGRLNTLFEAFNNLYNNWLNITYNPTDLSDNTFLEDIEKWRLKIRDFDARLAAIISLGFEECFNYEQIFKFINLFGPLLDRELVHKEMFPKYGRVVDMFDEDLDVVKEMYDEQMKRYRRTGYLEVPSYWPPIAGGLCWVSSMRRRVKFPLDWLENFKHPSTRSPKFMYAQEKAEEMNAYLDHLQYDLYDVWREQIGEVIEKGLEASILTTVKGKLVVNFATELIAVVKEVRYMKMLEVPNIPDSALDLYRRMEELYLWKVKLMKTVDWYNKMRINATPQEFDIISEEIDEIDDIIEEGVKIYNWKNPDAVNFIDQLYDSVEALATRVTQAQENLKRIDWLINQWNYRPIYERVNGNKKELLEFRILDRVNARYDCILLAGDEIYDLINKNFRLLHNLPLSYPWLEEEEELEEEELEEEENILDQEAEVAVTEPPEQEKKEADAELEKARKTTAILQALLGAEFVEGGVVEEGEEAEDEGQEEVEKETKSEKNEADEAEEKEGEIQGPRGGPPEEKKKKKKRKPCPDIDFTQEMDFERPAQRAQYLSDIWKLVRGPTRPDLSYEEIMESMEHPEEVVKRSVREKKKKKGKKNKGKGGKKGKADKGGKGKGKKGAKGAKKAAEPVTAETETTEATTAATTPTGTASTKPNIEYSPEYKKLLEEGEILPDDVEEEEIFMTPSMLLFEQFKKHPEKILKWDAYLDYIDELVQEGLLHAVGAGIAYLLDEMKEKKKKAPLFLVRMMLLPDNALHFEPLMEEQIENKDALIGIIWLIIQDINAQALLIPRISYKNREKTYLDEVGAHEDIVTMEESLVNQFLTSIADAEKFSEKYLKYSFLWKDDREEHLRQFLKFARILEQYELELEGKYDEEGSPILSEKKPSLDEFKEKIDFYEDLDRELDMMPSSELIECWLICDVSLFKERVLSENTQWSDLYKDYLFNQVVNSLNELDSFINDAKEGMSKPLEKGDYDGLVKVMGYLLKIRDRTEETDGLFDRTKQTMDLLKQYGIDFKEQVYTLLADMPSRWEDLKKQAMIVKTQANPLMQAESNTIRKRLSFFEVRQNLFMDEFRKKSFFTWECEDPYREIDKCNLDLCALENLQQSLTDQAALFEVNVPEFALVAQVRKELRLAKMLWDYILVVRSMISDWEFTKWKKIDSEAMDMELKKFAKEIRTLDKDMRAWDIYLGLEAIIKNLITALRAITELQNPAIRDRHWHELMVATEVKFVIDDETTLKDLLDLNLYKFEEEVKTIVDKSVKEQGMEKTLGELQETWTGMEFEWESHPRSGIPILRVSEELIETLEADQVNLQNMLSSKFIAHFFDEVSTWQNQLSNADQVINTWMEVQRAWMYLESIFIGSEDIRRQLPEDSKRFDTIDKDFRGMLHDMHQIPNVLKATNRPNLYEKLDVIQKDLIKCEKALAQYLETKRLAYPRFYFVSSSDLLDILSNSNVPELVCKHLAKLYDSLAKLHFKIEGGQKTKEAITMQAKDGEQVPLSGPCDCRGQVENWLNNVTDIMRATGHFYMSKAVKTYDDKPREEWIFDYPAQTALLGTQVWWATEVTAAFAQLEEGYENALKDYQKKQINQLNTLINLLLGELTEGDRQKIMTICTIDVHSRDVVAKLILMKVENSLAFQWQSQLRHRWDVKLNDCYANICDAQFRYDYEYLGNTPRLVITPLTDRCYITLTQSLHLIMGGAPAGPAGTGKTETTKDLGKAIGIMVYVFNCSEQMDYKSCGNIYKGLAQTGAWGCFDEFNRISVEVLSVVAVQVKSVLDAIKAKKNIFNFQGERIKLVPTVGMFITMNPGYAGRAELPENLKALFRPCAMVVPDFELICEIMLIAEGFQEARLLARKFITLYSLCKELLSKQDHYDWGLRAIKSVLVVAGSLKRGDRQRPEDQVLMRALRDFNIPKIVTDDRAIFMGLIGDLFPSLDVPRKRDLEFEKQCKQGTIDMKLQPEDNFILKIVQLVELFAVRHSVFIIGNAGTGKSMVWKTLHRTYANMKRKPYYNDLEPKAVTNDELFGIINPQTREWKDGLFSVLIREQANMAGDGPKWMVMDGDIDPMWIESLNTVMDDNKVLTLASNERIALTKSMRLLFEISNLRTATPATVSRAGILYINPTDLGWSPCIASWVDTRKYEQERTMLTYLIDKYVPSTFEITKKFKKITPIPEIAHIHMLITLLECLLVPANVTLDSPREWYETYFVFACVWAFGSACFQDQLTDWRMEFTKWWVNEFKTIKFPPEVMSGNAQVFNYCIDQETKKFKPWSERVQKFDLDYDVPLQATLVNTAETTRVRYFLDLLIERRKAVMLIAPAGAGKSVLANEKFKSLSDDYAVTSVPFNFYTTSEMLQKVLEKPLEKKAGRNYGPQGNKVMIYFIDDLNMPEVDKYGTVQPHTLIRQYMDYQHWYDRVKLSLKDIHNIMFLSSMNPTAGSFTIDSRLQRHFIVFALRDVAEGLQLVWQKIERPEDMAGSQDHTASISSGCGPTPTCQVTYLSKEAALRHIYSSILTQHVGGTQSKFPLPVVKACDMIINLALTLHAKVALTFLPTAIKFHYIFNLRDLSNIFQSIILTGADCINTPAAFLRLWMHESYRVYRDKMVDHKDQDTFEKIILDIVKKVVQNNFDVQDIPETEYNIEPLIFTHFVDGLGDPKYLQMPSWDRLQKILTEAMGQYNDLVATMNLVLFEDAMSHICRINRVMEMPRGNALLVGVGGSGKQSLSRLSAFISSLESFQVQLKKGYSIADLKADVSGLYLKAGLKNLGIMFLMTDSQVPEERFLVLINDLLASGEIPELFADDEIDQIIQAIAPEAKGAGIPDSRENCWKFFIDRTRRNLKVILCFSPVGSTLRVRARKFPALVNCTTIDWFMEWPKEALENVSSRFLAEIDVLPPHLVNSLSLLMAFMHSSVNEMSHIYLLNERRYNYTTPKSFLELINLYTKLLRTKNKETTDKIERLQTGLQKLVSCSEQVAVLKVQLAEQDKVVQQKNAAASELISEVATEKEKVQKEQAVATDEERKVRVIEEDVLVKQKICEEDLAKAEPALLAAQEALNTLNKTNLTEMKSFGTPPEAVAKVAAAVMVLLAKKGKIPKDRSWKAAKAIMGSADSFLSTLVNYPKENIHPDIVKAIQPYINDPDFTPENVITKSSAAAGLCSWVINIMKFHEVWMVVLPKRKALAAANAELAAARQRLQNVKERIAFLEEKFGKLMKRYNFAMNEKRKCEMEVQRTAESIDLANRLVNGLASENVRWRQSVSDLRGQLGLLPGDILFVTAFISYVGCFTRRYREDLLFKYWIPQLPKYNPPIPLTKDLDPMQMLTDDAQIAEWNNEGLPNDRMSAENATILTNSERWPLMIDPQLQGIKWIKTKYGSKLRIIRLGQKNYLDRIEKAVSEGSTLLIEYIGETIDAVLDNLLGRQLIRKGKVLKIGDREIDYHPMFRLILHTKLANPHYQPEIQAQTTLINFTVTRDGLEEQLLAEVVNAERPDLEAQKGELTMQQNIFKITLKTLEDDLLQRLSSAGPNILSDRALVINLENTKKTAEEITVKVAEAKITSKNIDNAREIYRSVATRASIIYFIMNELNKINPLYQFSLKAFSIVFHRAIKLSEKSDSLDGRVLNLIDSITFSTFMYTSRGLFECDKLTFMAQLAIQILLNEKEISLQELDFLLRFPYVPNETSPVDFLTNVLWGGILALTKMDVFNNLDKDIVGSKKRWKKFCEGESPERDKLPQDWKNKTAFQRLCIMRSLRPDRMTYATRCFIEEKLGSKFTNARSVEFDKSYEEMSAVVPCFFILSAGVDPTRDVEKVGKRIGFTTDRRNFHNVSLGQGQEVVAETAIETGSRLGHWVILQNIHLVRNWLPTLDKKMEAAQENPHWNYRLFLSSEPAPDPSMHAIPQGVLESSIKITNEPPTGMLANIHKALDNFNQSTLEMCSKEAEFKAILFSLCYFHAVVAERRKFGPQGWNRSYPFNVGDLTISVHVLYNYLENNTKIPWEDLRYLFGEIMYGGHITDDWDRRLCRTYLEEFMCPDLVEAELFYAPGFPAPPNSDYVGYHMYVDAMLPPESPVLYGLHPNAEIGFLTTLSENLFRTILELQPRDSGAASSGGATREEKVGQILAEILDKVPDVFNIPDMMARVEDKTPYIIVAFQECERMNILMKEIKRSLEELRLGLKGELTITNEMEELEFALFMDSVPPRWSARAYPSLLGLSGWYADLISRLRELESWVGDFQLPSSVWLGGFFNPQSFLTAIMQSTARKNEWPLDKMCLQCDVTKKVKEEFSQAPRDGAYINGMYMEGARWDIAAGVISESLLKEMFPLMPVIHVKAITQDKQETKNIYECPVYKTRQRGPTFVWTFNLKTKAKPAKWTLAGVCLLLST